MRFPTMWYVRPAMTQNHCLSLEYSMSVKLLAEHHLEFLSLKRGYTGSSESTLVKIPHCWKSHDTAQVIQFEYITNCLPDSGQFVLEKTTC